MIGWARLAAALGLAAVAGCGENAVPMGDCYTELDQLPVVDTVTIDVEELVADIVVKLGALPVPWGRGS